MQTRTKVLPRIISLVLSVVLLANLITPALAVLRDAPTAEGLVLVDGDGKQVAVDASWEETFPYGTFAFDASQLALTEGDGAQTIRVYRLGGTRGKAELTLSFSPAVTQLDDGTYSFANAAGILDFDIEVEDALPIAAYQAFGQDAAPLAPAAPVSVSVVEEDSTENTVDEAGETVYGYTVLQADVKADGYQWQALNANGIWENVGDGEATLEIDNEVLELSDFRCVYTVGGVSYCTDSLGGEPYVAEENLDQEIPDDVERNPAQSFHKLDMQDGEYDTYEFYMTFAEGEWVKEIRITPIDDDRSENVELVSFRIDACKGGELYDTANTLLVSIEDNDEILPSQFSFPVTDVTVDKAAGSALLTVERTGALQYVTTVDYHTVDGTATAGQDYVQTSGTLYFSSDVSEMTIEVPLIDDGAVVDEADADCSFTVVLENPQGGGTDSSILDGAATVRLYNSGTSQAPNLATMLYTPEADDVSGSTETTTASIVGRSSGSVSATPVEQGEAAPVAVTFGSGDGDVSLLTYDLSAELKLNRSALPSSRYWVDNADLGGMGSYNDTNNAQGLAYQGWDDPSQLRYNGSYYGRYKGDVGGGNSKFSCWNTQTFESFDQLFTTVYATYHGKTENNTLNQFHTVVWAGVANSSNVAGGSNVAEISRISGSGAGSFSNVNRTYTIKKGAAGIFFSFGIEDRSGGEIRHAGCRSDQIARAARRTLSQPVSYLIHTADDNAITAADRVSLYNNIAPQITVPVGQGGTTSDGKVYVGTQLSLSKPLYSTYSYAEGAAAPVYLSTGSTTVNTGAVADDGSASLRIIGGSGNSFANGGNLSTSSSYTVNAVLNRSQKINVNVAPSVPRLEDGRTIDPDQIQSTLTAFWKRANQATVTWASANTSGNRYDGTFTTQTSFLTNKLTFSAADSKGNSTSATKLDNVKSINFHLPHADQILFNGVQYNGDDDIPIPVGMFGAETLSFTYYQSDYVSVESDMTLVITRVEHYVDMNGNGMLDGYLDNVNQFHTEAVNGVEDVLVQTLSAQDYTATTFTPVLDENGNARQQFLKFYYNMTPRCLTVPTGASATDRAQILPSFVTSVTDASDKAALSTEMQGYRFITSGKYSKDFDIYNNIGQVTDTKKAGTWSGDGKLMYQAAANATETVDIPLGGDFDPIHPTYVYSDGTESLDPPSKTGKTLTDVTFKRENWNPKYQGNMLYPFRNPEPIFVSDSLVGENLPVANLVSKAGENGTASDTYSADQLNAYLGSFNPLDTVALCIRPQSLTTDEIQALFHPSTISTLDIIESGEHRIEVDSSNPAGFKSIPDASGLRRTSAGDADVTQAADSGNSSNSMSEFNVDLGIELPSLSVGLTDYVTLITDGSEFGFSIGIPVFKAEKSTTAYTASDKRLNPAEQTAYGKWERSGPIQENAGNLSKIKNAFANPGELIKGEEWQKAKEAQRAAVDSDKLIRSKGMEFSVAFNVTIMFKYSPTENAYRFTSAMLFLQFGFQFKQTIRLTVCPIVYAYFVVGASLELAGGVVNEREVVEDTSGMLDVNTVPATVNSDASAYNNGKLAYIATNLSTGLTSGWKTADDEVASGKKVLAGSKGDAFTFISKSDAVNLYFSGKVKVELKDGSTWNNLGYVASDGSAPVLVMFDEKVDGTANQEVRITVLDEDANFDRVVPISGVRNDTFFSGLTVSPSVFLEVGAGIGVEVLKVEIYFKASIGISMSFATRQNNAATKGSQLRDPSSSSLSLMGAEANVVSLDDTVSALDDKVEPFSFDSFNFRAGFGVRVVLLLFNFELDAIQFGINYSKGMDTKYGGSPEDGFHDNGWKFAWYTLNGGQTISSYDLREVDDSEGFPGIRITLPSNTFAAQQIFGPENAQMVLDEIDALAFDPENLPGKEFQISGYSSSGDAFRLAKDLATGTDYQLLTVGQDNYLLYTISRENPANAVDSNMLVLSKLQNTGETVGLAHPVTGSTATNQNYLPVEDDGTGDLDFGAQVSGDTIHVSWVTYATPTSADGSTSTGGSMPDSAVHPRPSYAEGENTVYMDKDNYEDAGFQPTGKPSAPDEPDEPEITQAPNVSDYYLTAEAYEALDDEAQAAQYAQDQTDTGYYHTVSYASYAAASLAYDEAVQAHQASKGEWDAYRALKAAYDTDQAAYDQRNAAYTAWYKYFSSEKQSADTAQELLSNSARNTVVKSASFPVGSDGFTAAKTLSDGTGAYQFLPAVSPDGRLTFYARTINYTPDEKAASTQKAQDYYSASRGGVTTDADGVSTGEGDPTAAFRYAYTTSMDDVYGKATQFMFSYRKDDGSVVTTGFTPEGWESAGTRLSSVSMAVQDNGAFYLAYTATQTQTEADPDTGRYGDKNVHKLYLQKGSVNADGAVTLETAKMLRQLVDVNDMGLGDSLTSGLSTLTGGSGSTVDGVYANRDGVGAVQIEAFEDPYFGPVRFLTGKLGNLTGEEESFGESLAFTPLDVESSLFLLFEMNGGTYVVPQSSLERITTDGKGSIIPFFSPIDDDRTKGGVSIGTDGEGNITAVYTDTVPNTTNNAIYVSKYSYNEATGTGSFGEGRMLAMNYMQVYEDAIANGWSPEETEQAYYGKLEGYRNGGMSSFTFSNLDVALGLKAGAVIGQEPNGEGGTQDITASSSTLVILAQGTQTALEEKSYLGGDGAKVILPKYDDNGSLVSTTGYYALSFGVGEKNVGEGSITFAEPNFTPGAMLQPTITFKNTGDVPLRGSASDPITVELWISSQPDENGDYAVGERLAQWILSDEAGVAVGQTVTASLDDYTSALPKDLEGRKFYFTVSETGKSEEHPFGVEDPIAYSSLTAPGGITRTIEAQPELAVEDLSFTTVGVEGDQVRIGVSMKVTNRGGADSAAPYLQFAYQTGRTMEEVQEGDTDYQKAVYAPLNLSSGQFEISDQAPIEAFSVTDDRAKGILRLEGADGADLKKGNARKVTGTFLVSKDAYCEATATGSLNLQVTVIDSDASITSLSAEGLQVSAFDNEYVSGNNSRFEELEPLAFFTAPVKITLPLSTTLRLSLPVSTTNRENPVISVSELNSQAMETTEKHLGILYYNMGASGTGSDGFLVISPSSEGSGIIRVSDMATSTWTDIAYTVTESGTGVNIFKDNDIFTWYSKAGMELDPNTDASGAWTFQKDVMHWGPNTTGSVVPYLGDLSRANQKGLSFSFTTLAEKIDLYFNGTVTVSSDFPGYAATTYSAAGGEGEGSFATIILGANPLNEAHTVTVTTVSDTTLFDRMIETFSKNQDILPDTGGDAPQIYFGRVLPETASLDPAGYPDGFPLTVYLLDESGLGQSSFDGGTSGATTGNAITHSESFREFTVYVKQNGTFSIQVSDTAGNSSKRTVRVDWFNTPVSTPDVPVELSVTLVYRDSQGTPLTGIGDTTQLKKDQYAFAQVDTSAGAAVSVQFYRVTTVTTTTAYELRQEEGGWYLVQTLTRTDVAGNPVEEPVVTKTAASADTALPKDTTLTETQGVWVDVAVREDGLYPVEQNGVYKVVSTGADGGGSTRLFVMDRLNSDLPTLDLTYVSASQSQGDAIGYIVSKGKTSQAGIQSIRVNGCDVYTAPGTAPSAVTGSFPITYGGTYTFAALDTAGNEQRSTIPVQMAIRPLEDGWLTVDASFAQTRDNGRVTVDPSKVVGGVYDPALSSVEQNVYGNAYQFALVADADKFDQAEPDTAELSSEDAAAALAAYHAAFDAFADALTWQDASTFSSLAPGDYVLYVRDKEDTPAGSVPDDYLIRALTVADVAVSFTARAANRSEAGIRTVTVNAFGGSGQYEFFIMKRSRSTDLLDADGIAAAIAQDDSLSWKTSGTGTYIYVKQDYGWHQVAVRDLENPENLYTAMVRLRRPSSPAEVVPTTGGPSQEEQADIIRRNQEEDVILTTDDCVVILPAGTLTEGDSVTDLLITLPDTLSEPLEANVVQYTSPDGETSILPWCMLSDGRMIYLANKVGKYELVHNAKSFTDVDGHWALEFIDFVTARELFNGTAEELFSAEMSMTRGMFVTVLGRLEGMDPQRYTAQSFEDVASGVWYAPYVEWATRNGVISGYGNGKFGPNDPITREQMAVILYNYAGSIDQNVGTVGDLSGFSDQEQVSGWARTQMAWAVGCGLINGKSGGALDPAGRATRSEVAAILERFVGCVLTGYTDSDGGRS